MATNRGPFRYRMPTSLCLPAPASLHFSLLRKADARAIQSWRYAEPYATYNLSGDSAEIAEMLDRRSPYFAVRTDAGDLIGFFAFGSSAEVGEQREPHLYTEDGGVSIGLGLRPDRTGQGLGLHLVEAGLALGRARYAPAYFRLFVLAWNTRAIRVYERAGFRWVGLRDLPAADGIRHFFEMRRDE